MNRKIPSLLTEFGHLMREIKGLPPSTLSRKKLKARRKEIYKHLSFYYDQIPKKVRKLIGLKKPDNKFFATHTSPDNEYLP